MFSEPNYIDIHIIILLFVLLQYNIISDWLPQVEDTCASSTKKIMFLIDHCNDR